MWKEVIDGKPFSLNYEQVVKEGFEDLSRGKFRYVRVLVSARYDRAPILMFGEGLKEIEQELLKTRMG